MPPGVWGIIITAPGTASGCIFILDKPLSTARTDLGAVPPWCCLGVHRSYQNSWRSPLPGYQRGRVRDQLLYGLEGSNINGWSIACGSSLKFKGRRLQATSGKRQASSLTNIIKGSYRRDGYKESITDYRRQPKQTFKDAWMVDRFTSQRMQNRQQATAGEGLSLLRLLRHERLLCF